MNSEPCAACAQKDEEIVQAQANWKRYAQAAEDAEAACNANIKRIAELEIAYRELAQRGLQEHPAGSHDHWFYKFHDVRCAEGKLLERIAELEAGRERIIEDRNTQDVRIEALTALLERVPHNPHGFVGRSNQQYDDCPRCAYEELREQWKEKA